jgi:CheY-like chemotaxis protein
VRQTLQQIVESMVHEAITTERASRARRVLEETAVDAMLLDLQMPGAHGDHMLSFMRKWNVPLPPTIVISGYLHRDRAGPLIRLGIEGIIAKPFRVQRVIDELERVLPARPDSHFVYCTGCGTAAAEPDLQCRKCDKRLERSYACPECESLQGPGARFCSQFGERLVMARLTRPDPDANGTLSALGMAAPSAPTTTPAGE